LSDLPTILDVALSEHLAVIEELRTQQPILERIAAEMTRAILSGNKILWCGNGGSAGDAQHLAAELVGRFRRERPIALTTDTSVLTSIANDYGFEQVFSRQVEALCVEGDVVVGISTSGNSPNVCAAMAEARKVGAFAVAFTGQGGGGLAGIADVTLRIASKDTARIQEAHILCGHILCDWIELSVCESRSEKEALSQ
jgi:D-sedoheptulose 7-phosphate isomerase